MNIPSRFSPEMTMIVIDHDTNIYIEWHNIINGNRKKHQSLLLRGISFGQVHDHHHWLASFLDMVTKKPNTRTRG